MGKLITRPQQVREANDIQYSIVEVPEWGEDAEIRLRSLSARGLVAFTSLKGGKEKEGIVRGLVMSACDEQGELIFSDSDVSWLMEKNVAILRRIQDAILELNGLKDSKKDALEDAGKD